MSHIQRISVNGLRTTYRRQGQGIPLFLLHGFPLDHSIWEPLLPHLTGRFDVILPDLRGFGGSSGVGTVPVMDDFAADLAGLFDQLQISRAFVVGHSMGGYVALSFARKFASRLLGLGLVSSQALPDTPERKAGRYASADAILTKGMDELAANMSARLSANPAHVPALKALILRQPPSGAVAALQAMAERADSTDFLPDLSIPVALIHGLADALIPVERSREIQALLPAAHLTEIPGVGHMPMMEAPAETAAGLLRLI